MLGPIIIFDKSVLESLNPDESAWLDHFFTSNITPLFYAETLADLDGEVRKGRKPEDVVGSIAYRTPDMNAVPNMPHADLVGGDLMGATVDMRFGRPILRGARPVSTEGKTGFVFDPAPEQLALDRWQNSKFLEIEREQAKAWRAALALLDPAAVRKRFRPLVEEHRPRDLAEVKALTDQIIDRSNDETALSIGLEIENVAPELQRMVLERWKAQGKPPIRTFAPYFRHSSASTCSSV